MQVIASANFRKNAEALDDWLTEAQDSPFSEVRTFATGVTHDKAAVTAALMRAESNGQVEGLMTRLKLIKRMIYFSIYIFSAPFQSGSKAYPKYHNQLGMIVIGSVDD